MNNQNDRSKPTKRRKFLKLAGLGTSGLLFSVGCKALRTPETQANTTSSEGLQVIVVGAGIAGLAAAQTVQEAGVSVLVLEGRDRIGGRIWTDHSLGVPIDLGASWIHGPDGNPITPIAKQAKTPLFVTDDDSVIVFNQNGNRIADQVLVEYEEKYEQLLEEIAKNVEDLEQDISLLAALKQIDPRILEDLLMQYQLTAYLEFDSGGDLKTISAQYWEHDEIFSGDDVLFPNGYDQVIEQLAKGLDIKTKQVVEEITYNDQGVVITTNQDQFQGDYAIITLPLGVLKAETVTFSPILPQRKRDAIQRVGMGQVNKVVLSFKDAFWQTEVQYFGYTSPVKGKYPYFLNTRTFSDFNGLMTFGFGEYALEMEKQSNEKITRDILDILQIMFKTEIPDPENVLISRWNADPFARGSYSFAAVGSTPEDLEVMRESVRDRLFFAGEHTSVDYSGAVHGAYLTGVQAAEEMLKSFG